MQTQQFHPSTASKPRKEKLGNKASSNNSSPILFGQKTSSRSSKSAFAPVLNMGGAHSQHGLDAGLNSAKQVKESERRWQRAVQEIKNWLADEVYADEMFQSELVKVLQKLGLPANFNPRTSHLHGKEGPQKEKRLHYEIHQLKHQYYQRNPETVVSYKLGLAVADLRFAQDLFRLNHYPMALEYATKVYGLLQQAYNMRDIRTVKMFDAVLELLNTLWAKGHVSQAGEYLQDLCWYLLKKCEWGRALKLAQSILNSNSYSSVDVSWVFSTLAKHLSSKHKDPANLEKYLTQALKATNSLPHTEKVQKRTQALEDFALMMAGVGDYHRAELYLEKLREEIVAFKKYYGENQTAQELEDRQVFLQLRLMSHRLCTQKSLSVPQDTQRLLGLLNQAFELCIDPQKEYNIEDVFDQARKILEDLRTYWPNEVFMRQVQKVIDKYSRFDTMSHADPDLKKLNYSAA